MSDNLDLSASITTEEPEIAANLAELRYLVFQGETGNSAYEEAVAHGFVGTEEEWLASLKGEPGANGRDGQDGAPGTPGRDGVSPTVTTKSITGGHRVTITDAAHPTGQTFDVMDGDPGDDYVLTNQDKQEIAGMVPVPTVPTDDISANTAARHTHENKAVLDGITEAKVQSWDGKGTYSKPNGGIPKSDLASAVQTSLGKADTALQDGANITNNLGFCYVNVGAGQTATELVGTNANWVPKNGGIIVCRFLTDAPANATINISGKGAKAVYFRNSALAAGTIKSGDVAAFVYYPDRYYLISIDRWQNDIKAIQNAGYQTASDVQDSIEDYILEHDITGEDSRLDSLATFTDGEETVVPLFTNAIPASVDTDGTPYQSGAGYIDGYRMKSSTGELLENEGSGVTGFIPLPENAANMVLRFGGMRLIASGTSTGSSIHFYDASFAHTHGAQTGQGVMVIAETDEDGYVTRVNCADQTNASFVPIAGDAYFRVSAYGMNEQSVITINEEITYGQETVSRVVIKPSVEIPQIAPLDARITELENDSDTVDSTDPLFKYADQIDKGLTVGYEPTLTNRPTADLVVKKYLNFLHISDTHGSVNAENAVKILNKLKADGRCSFLIHTGDIHASTFADVASWNSFAGYIEQAIAPVLLVSGNHDVGNNSQSTTNGQTATDAQLYARCFEPYISDWNLTSHPDGKCYWYKDFADEGVRLIGLYDFESDYATDSTTGDLLYKRGYAAYHQAQIDWFVQALLTCPSGYGVIIAKHNPMNLRGTLDNPFNGEFLQGQNTSQSYVSKDMIAEIVQAFMDGTTINKTFAQTGNVTDTLTVNQDFSGKNSGAHFICYLDGHTHADGVNFLADFPNQLELNIGCDNYHYQHYADTLNQQGTLHQDLLNYVSVDVNRGYVYIQRIGNDFTAQADRRDFTAIDYKNPPTAADDPSEAIEALDSRIAVFEDYPLVKEYTADSVQTGIFVLPFDKPLKALRVFIEGVANSDVSAKQSVTLQIGTGSTSYYSANKILYGQIVSNTVFTAFIDVRLDKAMKKWISDGAIGTVNATNGFLSTRQLDVVNASVDEGRTNIYQLRIRNDSDQTNGVSVTTGTTIKVYGLEA